jgi:hypothetical protein
MNGTRCRFFDHALEPFSFTKGNEFPESMNDCPFLKKKSVPWSYIECYDKDTKYL